MLNIKINGLKEVIWVKVLELESITLKISAKEIKVSGHPIKYFKTGIILFIPQRIYRIKF